jgi:hypothetical protein
MFLFIIFNFLIVSWSKIGTIKKFTKIIKNIKKFVFNSNIKRTIMVIIETLTNNQSSSFNITLFSKSSLIITFVEMFIKNILQTIRIIQSKYTYLRLFIILDQNNNTRLYQREYCA